MVARRRPRIAGAPDVHPGLGATVPDPIETLRPATVARRAPSRAATAWRALVRLSLALLVLVGGAAAIPSGAQAAYPSEAAYVCGAETQPWPGGTLSMRSILHPGCGNLVGMERFAEPAIDAYYRQFGFDRNFLRWAPRESRTDIAHRKHAGCSTPHAHGTLCPGGAGNVGFGYSPADDWDGPTTVKIWGTGFISLACGNFSQDGTRAGPAPRISGTKYEDRNGNGRRDAGEPGIGGVTVRLRLNGVELASRTTAADGGYRFVLDAEADARYTQGTYTVVEDVPAGYRQTAAPAATFVPFGAADTDYAGRDIGNQKVTDLGIVKTASKPTTIAGESLSWTLAVRNHGLWPAPGVVVTDQVPAAFDSIDQLDPACTLTGHTLRCELGTLAAGAQRVLSFRSRARPDLARGSTVTNAAAVTTEMPDTNPANDRDDDTTAIDTRADLTAGKRVDAWHVLGGGDVVYRLTVRNDGPSYARDVRLSDPVPSLVEIVSTEPGGACSVVLQLVSCTVGDLAPGASAEIVVRGRAVGLAPPSVDPSHGDHLIGVDRAETAVSLDAGQQRTIDTSCPDGGIVTDGSLRIDAVDQGTGTKADVIVRESYAVSRSTYRVVVENTATGRAQGHATVTCLRPRTVGGDGASHALLTDAPVTRTDALPVGRHTVRLAAGLDRHAVAPGFEVLAGQVRWVGSEPTPDGWELTFDVLAAATVRTSIVPLHGRLEVVDGHTHRLAITHPVRTVTLPPGQSEHSIDCAPLEKGITASWDAPSGIVPIGEEGRPRTRNFWFWNPGGSAVSATIDVVCVGDRTGTPLDPIGEVRNTVTVTSDTQDPAPGDESASATIVIDRAVVAWGSPAALEPPASPSGAPSGAPAPAVGPLSLAAVVPPSLRPGDAEPSAGGRVEPAPRSGGLPAPSVAVAAHESVAVAGPVGLPRRGRTVTARIRCREACSLRVELRVRGRVAAAGRVERRKVGTAKVRLRLTGGDARRARSRGATLVVRDRIGDRVVARAPVVG